MCKYALYLGCVIPTEQYAYELSIRETLPKLGVELVDLEGFSCCGAPLRSINLNLTLYLSARNLAICEKTGLDVLAPCAICHLGLSETKQALDKNPTLKEKINSKLSEEGLSYKGELGIFHILDLLHDKVGLEKIKENVEKELGNVKIAAHYGCHLIRPSTIERPDHPENPQKLEALLKALGAETMDYSEKLNCCGAPLTVNLPESAFTKAGQKLKAVQDRGFQCLATLCPWGHRIMDSKQKNAADTVGEKLDLPVVYLTQLLGIALGVDREKLGLKLNLSPIGKLEFIEGEKP